LRLPSEGPAELGNDLPEMRRRILLPGVGRVADQGDEPGELLPDQVARRGRAVEEGRVRVGARAELLDLAELALQGVPRTPSVRVFGRKALHRSILRGDGRSP